MSKSKVAVTGCEGVGVGRGVAEGLVEGFEVGLDVGVLVAGGVVGIIVPDGVPVGNAEAEFIGVEVPWGEEVGGCVFVAEGPGVVELLGEAEGLAEGRLIE